MTDADDPTDDPDAPSGEPTDAPEPDAPLDVDQENERLEEMGKEGERLRSDSAEDLEPGGRRRSFTDQGVGKEVEETGDSDRPPADR